MKLLLTSSGLSNQSTIDALLELAEKHFSELNAVFIPTAANFENGDKSWLENDLTNCKNLNFKNFEVIDIATTLKNEWLAKLQIANIIIVGGGNTSYLMSWVEKSGLKELLPEMLKTKIYVGISAGSVIICPTLDSEKARELYDEETMAGVKDNGLGLINFLVRPHLNSTYFPNLNINNLEKISKTSAEIFYAIDDKTAIVVNDNKIKIISEGQWKKFN